MTPIDGTPFEARSRRLARVCTVEVWVHLTLLTLVVAPITLLVLPSVISALGLYTLGQAATSTGPLQLFGVLGRIGWPSLVLWAGAATSALAIAAGLTVYRRSPRTDDEIAMRAPSGAKGALLLDAVRRLWARCGGASDRCPTTLWYANFSLLAHATSSHGHSRIEVSSGLWERIVKGDAIAEIILAHEIAHLVYRDPAAFRTLAAVAAARRHVSSGTIGLAAVVLLLLVTHVVASGLASSEPVVEIAVRSAATAAVVSSILLIVPLGAAALARYAGFIASLIEIRADVLAALWTDGLERFASMLSNDPTVRRSSFRHRRSSVLSLHLTHISETERQELLNRPERLITPKLRYFALSLALALLLPINALTPVLAAGALDHLVMLSATGALHAGAVAMLALSGGAASLSWQRSIVVAAALCIALALPRINLGGLGYLLTHEAVSIAHTEGFGADPLSVARVRDDVAITFLDLAQTFVQSLGSLWLLAAIAVTAAALRRMADLSRRTVEAPGTVPTVACATVAATLAVVLSGYDEWRAAFYLSGSASLAAWWVERTEDVVWLRLSAPALAALAVMQLAALRAPSTQSPTAAGQHP